MSYPGALLQGHIVPQTAAVKIVECSLLKDYTFHAVLEGKSFGYNAAVDVRFRLLNKQGGMLADELADAGPNGFFTARLIGIGALVDPADIGALECSVDRILPDAGPLGLARNQWLQTNSDLLQCPVVTSFTDSRPGAQLEGVALGRDWAAVTFSGSINTFIPYPRSTLQDDPFIVQLDRDPSFEVLLSEQYPSATIRFTHLKPGEHKIGFGPSYNATEGPDHFVCFRMPRLAADSPWPSVKWPVLVKKNLNSLNAIERFKELPTDIQRGKFTGGGSRYAGSWSMAEPGTPWQKADEIGFPRVVWRRLIFGACSRVMCILNYEIGGIGYNFHIVVLTRAKSAWSVYWHAVGPYKINTFTELKMDVRRTVLPQYHKEDLYL